MGSALRGTGNFRPGMVVQTATVILNIVLAPVLIFGWGTGVALGVAGAALSTLVAIAIGVVWMVVYFLPADAYLRFSFRDWRPRFDLWRDMLKIGLPAGAEFALMAVYLMLVYVVSRPFGAAAQAGFGIGMRIIQACFLPVVALGFAVGPVAGQNFGARKADRVRETFRTGAGARCRRDVRARASIVWLAAGADGRRVLVRPARHRGRRGVSPHHRVQLRRLGRSCSSARACSRRWATRSRRSSRPAARIVIVAVPVLLLAQAPGFTLRWIWYISVGAVVVQLAMNLWLLQREFRLRLNFDTLARTPAASPPESAPVLSS